MAVLQDPELEFLCVLVWFWAAVLIFWGLYMMGTELKGR